MVGSVSDGKLNFFPSFAIYSLHTITNESIVSYVLFTISLTTQITT